MHKAAYYVINKQSDTQIIDARSNDRYNAEVDEPWPGLRRGHVPGAKNVFFMNLVDQETLTYKPDKDLAKEFLKADVDTTLSSISYCGSGITACIPILALNILGNEEKSSLYDGSWV